MQNRHRRELLAMIVSLYALGGVVRQALAILSRRARGRLRATLPSLFAAALLSAALLWPWQPALALFKQDGNMLVSSCDGLGGGGSVALSGDGTTAIVSGGDVAPLNMNGAQVTKAYAIGNASTAWSIVGTGDFNGDGYSDILWRDTSGNVAIWFALMGNPQFTPAGVGSAPTAWSIVETGDFDGDGMTDILWQDTSGNVAIWFMVGEHVKQPAGVGNAPTAWSIQGANTD